MASRPPDFKASGIRTERIIASGSDTNPKLYIIGKSAAGNDGVIVNTNDLILDGDGTDTWLYISGGIGNSNRVTFGGDVYISGTLTAAAGGGTAPGGANTEVQFNNAGAFSGSSGLKYIASTQTLVVANLTVTGTSTIVSSSNLVISDPLIYLASGSTSSNQNGGIALTSGSSVANQALVFGRVANDVWGVGRQDVAGGASISLTGMTHVPMRAAAIQLGGSVAVLTSSDGTTATLSGSSVQLKANATDGVKFYETGSEYLQFTMNGGSSALIRATESAYPSLYLSGQQVHLDASSGQTWFGKYTTETFLVDTSDSSNPSLVAKIPSGQAVSLTLSGSGVAIGSNDGTTSFKKGTTTYLRAIYNGVNDVTVSSQNYNVNFGSQGFAAVSGSTITLNSSNGTVLQRDGNTHVIISNNGINTTLSASNSIYVTPGAAGSLYVTGAVVTPNLTGSLTSLVDGTPYLIAGTNVTLSTGSNGAVTINSSGGGGGSPGGSDTYVQFNDGGSFGGDSGLAYNKTTQALTGTIIRATNGFSGSLTTLTDGTPYLVASSSSNMSQTGSISVTSGSANGRVTVNSYVFPNDLTVSLTGGRTFGRYATGATIPATGKTPAEVILLAIAEPINPTVNLTPTNPITSTFGISGSINTSITGSYTINTLGATVATATLQFRSGSTGGWSTLSSATTNPLYYDHTFTVGSFFTTILNYQYIITDSAGAVTTGSANLTPQAYSAPTMSLTVATTTGGGFTNETNSLRERGNVGSTISGTITRNRVNAPISSYSVQYQVNGSGGWTDVPGLSAVPVTGNPSSISIPSTSHNDSGLNTSTSLLYRIQVVDAYQTSTSGSTTITFQYGIFYGPSASAPSNSAGVRSLGTKTLVSAGGTTVLDTGNTQVNFTMALPTTVAATDTITSVIDLDALNADITTSYTSGLSTFNVNDGGGTAVSYKVYTMTIASPYASSHRHSITRA